MKKLFLKSDQKSGGNEATSVYRDWLQPRLLISSPLTFSFLPLLFCKFKWFFLITQIQILLPRGFSQSVQYRRPISGDGEPPTPIEILTRRKWKKPQEDLREEEIDKAWQIYRWPLHLPLSLHPHVFIPPLAPSDRFILLLGVCSILHLLLRRRLLLSGLCDLQTTDLQCIRWQALCKGKCWSVTGIHAHAASCLRSLLDLLWPPRWLQQRPVRF